MHPPEKPTCGKQAEQLGSTVFQQTKDDNKVAPSIDDITFIQIMEQGLKKDKSNSWVALLPFKTPRHRLPDNKAQALNRLSSLRRSLERKPVMKEHFFTFMEIFQNTHTEETPPNEERWYLPSFGVYHPRKPGNIHVVFDSSAVLAIELAELISSEIDMELDDTIFYSDSKVVLGYISNDSRRFYVYSFSNRVQRIRSYSRSEQWQYVSTDVNPADIATRSVTAAHLSSTSWFHGPAFLKHPQQAAPEESTFELLNPSLDTEILRQVSTMKTSILSKQLGSQCFSKFSSWNSLIHAIARLTHIACLFKTCPQTKGRGCKGWHLCHTAISVDKLLQAKRTVIHAVQEETYAQEYACIKKGEALPKDSPLKALDPFIDADGLLRVGGCIREAELQPDEKSPLIIPGKHHIATLLVRHHHQKMQHQGRLFAEGALRLISTGRVTAAERLRHGVAASSALRQSPPGA